MTTDSKKHPLLEHELPSGVFICVGCGAPLSFGEAEDTEGTSPVEQATCEYCEAVNSRALAELRKRGAADRHTELQARKHSRDRLIGIAGATLAVVLLAAIAAFRTQAELSTAHAEVERAAAQVTNVRERQLATVRQWDGAFPSRSRDAELSGAENRVRVERARYDEVASAYNSRAGGAWAKMSARLFGMPTRVRLSDEADW